jgi:hypothetical protein
MAPRDPIVDTYIDKSADFSKPILTHRANVSALRCNE